MGRYEVTCAHVIGHELDRQSWWWLPRNFLGIGLAGEMHRHSMLASADRKGATCTRFSG